MVYLPGQGRKRADMASRVIYYTKQLREQWPDPLAREWRNRYPAIFDDDDLRQTKTQPARHFFEWFTAVHIFHATGFPSLVEKAQYGKSHPRKKKIVDRILTQPEQEKLYDICYRYGVQWPDLVVYGDHTTPVCFAEAKGPGDTLSKKQIRSHRAIRLQLRMPVRVYEFVLGRRR
jgi:hypothetical protein